MKSDSIHTLAVVGIVAIVALFVLAGGPSNSFGSTPTVQAVGAGFGGFEQLPAQNTAKNKQPIPVDEYKLEADTLFNRIELNGNDLDGAYSALGFGGVLTSVQDIKTQFRPIDLDEDSEGYLLVDESITDPFLGIELSFEGVEPALTQSERSVVSVVRDGVFSDLTFTNRFGQNYSDIPVLFINDTGINYNIDFQGAVFEDEIFFTFEGSSSNPSSKIYELVDVDEQDNVATATFEDLATGDLEEVQEGETLGNTGLVIETILTQFDGIVFTSQSVQNRVNWFVTEGDMRVTFYGTSGNGDFFWTVEEDFNDRFVNENSEVNTVSWLLNFTKGNEQGPEVNLVGLNEVSGNDAFDDFNFAMTSYGTHITIETEDDGEFVNMFYPKNGEAQYKVRMTMPTGESSLIELPGDALNFEESFDLGSSFEFDRGDFPNALADRSINAGQWEYDQEIQFANETYPRVTFGIPDSDVDLPQLYVNFNNRATPAYQYVADFDNSVDFTQLGGRRIVMAGNQFTFEDSIGANDTHFILKKFR